jgi:putative ABC transport system permease protein
MAHPRSFSIRLFTAVYRLCIRLTPRRFRERFGDESEDTFRQLVEETAESRGRGAAVTLTAAACGDIARVGVAERAAAAYRACLNGSGADLRHAVRIYRREPILALGVATTLALISGPAVAIFSVLSHLVFAPLPYPNADRLVVVTHREATGVNPYLPIASVADYRSVPSFTAVTGISSLGSTLLTDGVPERIQTYRAMAGTLTLLGVPFAAGRDTERGAAEAVVTRAFAVSRFGSETAALHRTLDINRRTLTVVGVVAYTPPLPGPPGAQIFIPHVSADQSAPSRQRQAGQALVIGRLAPGVTIEIARAQVRSVAGAVRAQFGGEDVAPDLVTLAYATSGPFRVPLLMLAGIVTAVFILAVVSLAGLILARAAARASDVAVRRSLGASPWRLGRAWLAEAAMLGVPGIAAGTWAGHALLHYLGSIALQMTPIADAATRGRLLLTAIGLGGVTLALFATAPIAAGALHAPVGEMNRSTRAIAGRGRARSQSVLIVAQVAVSLALVTSAAWLAANLDRVLSRPVGFDATNLVVARVRTAQPREVQIEQARRAVTQLGRFTRLDRGPAVSSALPGSFADTFVPLRVRATEPVLPEAERPRLARAAVSTNYFHVLGIPLLSGRAFTAADEAAPETVVILSRSFASTWFPEGALGQVVAFGRDDRREVIGVVQEVHAGRLDRDSLPQFYVPMTDRTIGDPSTFLIRTPASVNAVRRDITAILSESSGAGSTITVESAPDAMKLPLTFELMTGRLTTGLALLATLLAVVNIYALSAWSVVQRRREIGIRMALGARSADAMRLVMRRGLLSVAAGVTIGAGLAFFLAAPLLRSQFPRLGTGEVTPLALGFLTVIAVATLASWVPARHATAIDPAITLRAE